MTELIGTCEGDIISNLSLRNKAVALAVVIFKIQPTLDHRLLPSGSSDELALSISPPVKFGGWNKRNSPIAGCIVKQQVIYKRLLNVCF